MGVLGCTISYDYCNFDCIPLMLYTYTHQFMPVQVLFHTLIPASSSEKKACPVDSARGSR